MLDSDQLIAIFRQAMQGIISPRTWLATGIFVVGLIGLLGMTLWGIRWWRTRQRAVASSDMQTVARNTSLPFAIQLISRAIDFGFVALLYRFVSQSSVGLYDAAALLVVQYLGTLADWGLTVLATRDIARDHSVAPTVFRTTLKLRLRLAMVAVPLAVLFVVINNGLAQAGIINNGLDRRQITIIALLTLTLFPSALSSAVTALFQAHERLEVPAAINLLTNIFSALLRVGALALGWGVVGVAGGALIGASIGAIVFMLALRSGFPSLALRGVTSPARPLLREGFPLLLNSLLMTVFFRFDTFIIQAFQGAAAVAIYGVGYKFISLTQIIPPVVVNALFPLLARRAQNDRDGMQRAYIGTLRLLITLAMPLAMAIMVLAMPLATLLAEKPEYLPNAGYALMLTIWYLPFSYINGLTQYVVIALGKQRTITQAFAITAIFNIALNLILIPRYGYMAAAAITVASELVLFMPLARVLKHEGLEIDIIRLLWRPLLAALVMGYAMWLAVQIHWLLAVMLAPIVFGLALFIAGGIGDEERQLFSKLRKRG